MLQRMTKADFAAQSSDDAIQYMADMNREVMETLQRLADESHPRHYDLHAMSRITYAIVAAAIRAHDHEEGQQALATTIFMAYALGLTDAVEVEIAEVSNDCCAE